MANIVFVMANFTGHLNATFKLAGDLRKRGHNVTYVGTEATRPKIAAQGFAFQSLPYIRDLSIDQPLRRLLRQRHTLRESAQETLAGVKDIPVMTDELVHQLKPDLLIFDPFYLIYAIPFYPHRIPALALSTKPLLDPDPLVPPYTSRLIPRDNFWSRRLIQLAWLNLRTIYLGYRFRMFVSRQLIGYSPYSLTKLISRQNSFPIEREWATRPLSYDFNLANVPEIVLHSEEFDFPRAQPVRANVHYIGPCVDLDRQEEPFDWSRIKGDSKLIFCSIGTIGTIGGYEEDFLRRVIEVFRDRPDYTLIMSVCRGIDSAALDPQLPNVQILPFVPQLQVLRRADLMINHGGANSIKECILLGVPMIVYARSSDQPGNSARVIYHGLGLRGDIHNDTSATIAAKIAHVLEQPRYRENVRHMQQHFLAYQRSQRHIEVIESYLKPATSAASASAASVSRE